MNQRGRLRGADTVHHQMVCWLERLGHRTNLPADGSDASDAPGAPAPVAATTDGTAPLAQAGTGSD